MLYLSVVDHIYAIGCLFVSTLAYTLCHMILHQVFLQYIKLICQIIDEQDIHAQYFLNINKNKNIYDFTIGIY
jgi:hypothetical protein